MRADAAVKIDIYCERTDPSFWAEPLNAATNAAFLLAALAAFLAARRAGRLEWLTAGMILLATAVGIGSFLWHSVAERWAGAADTIPILLFILLYVYAAARRYLGLPVLLALLAPPLYVGFTWAFLAGWRAALPGVSFSEGYLPVLVALLGFGAVLARRGHPVAPRLFAAAAVFAVSVTLRSLDGPLCGALPSGLHFLWHTLNGLLLWLLMLAFIRCGAPLEAGPGRR